MFKINKIKMQPISFKAMPLTLSLPLMKEKITDYSTSAGMRRAAWFEFLCFTSVLQIQLPSSDDAIHTDCIVE